MTGSRAPRRAAIFLGIAALAVLAAIGASRTARRCGHRPALIEQALARIALGDRSHLEVEAALERWKTRRTADDFQQILGHLPPGGARERLRELLGAPDRESLTDYVKAGTGGSVRVLHYDLNDGRFGIVNLSEDRDSVNRFIVTFIPRIQYYDILQN